MYHLAQHRALWARPSRRCLPAFLLTLIAAAAVTAVPPAAGASAQTATAGVTVTSHFVWTATSANIGGPDDMSTFINNFATNNRPGAILFVTPNWDQGGVCGCVYNSSPVGVYYDPTGRWTIFNENLSPMSAGVSFNVLVVPSASSSVFVQTATTGNSGGDSTFINSSLTNGRPAARLMVTQVFNPGGGAGGVRNGHTVGVWYDGSSDRWAIFQEDKANMTLGASFNVMVGTKKSGGGTSALQTATAANTSADSTFISNAKTTGNPNAVVFETPNWNPGSAGGTYDPPPTGIWWSDFSGQAAVFNQDKSAMPLNAAFNLIIYQS
jgi:hypothetical protein